MSMHVLVQNFRCSWKNVDRIPDIIQNVRIYMNVWQKRHEIVWGKGMNTSGILHVYRAHCKGLNSTYLTKWWLSGVCMPLPNDNYYAQGTSMTSNEFGAFVFVI